MRHFTFKRSIGWIVLILIIVSIGYLTASRVQEQKPHLVSQYNQQDAVEPIPESTPQKPTKKNIETAESVDLGVQLNGAENAKKMARSVLQIYRDLRLANSCEYYYRLHEEKQGRVTVREILHIRSGQAETYSASQYKAFEDFIQDCLSLKEEVMARAEVKDGFTNYTFSHPVIIELRKELSETKADTFEEKHLLEIRNMRAVFSKHFGTLLKVSQGDFMLSEEEQSIVRDEIAQLNEEMNRLIEDRVSGEELLQLSQELQEKYRHLQQRKPTDAQAREEALKPFIEVTEKMKVYLYGRYPYSFETALRALEVSSVKNNFFDANDLYRFENQLSLIPEYLTPSAELQVLANVRDKPLFLTVLEPAVNLYMCHLGDDCGPKSHYIRNFCFGHINYRPTFEQACDMHLMQFYMEVYLTKNQQKDVLALLDLLMDTYAL